MRASKRSRHSVKLIERKLIADEVRIDIARIVRRFPYDMPGLGEQPWPDPVGHCSTAFHLAARQVVATVEIEWSAEPGRCLVWPLG
jgi:hypothetical protein